MHFTRNLLLTAVICFLAYTFANKVLNLESFKLNIAKTGVFEGFFVDVVAYFALTAELCSIMALIVKERIGLLITFSVLIIFTAYTVMLYLSGRYEVCGCGGILNGLPFFWHLFINIVLILVVVYLIYSGNEEK